MDPHAVFELHNHVPAPGEEDDDAMELLLHNRSGPAEEGLPPSVCFFTRHDGAASPSSSDPTRRSHGNPNPSLPHIKGRGQDYWQAKNIVEEMPCCRQMFNVFHPFDPVAYIDEPLVCEDYVNKRPIVIPYHRGGKRIHVGVQEFTEDVAARSHTFARQFKSLKAKALAALLSLSKNDMEGNDESTKEEERSYGSMMMERLTGSPDGRVDHVLQVAIMAVGASQPTVVGTKDGRIGIKSQMQVNVTADHRVIYGSDLAAFLQTLQDNCGSQGPYILDAPSDSFSLRQSHRMHASRCVACWWCELVCYFVPNGSVESVLFQFCDACIGLM